AVLALPEFTRVPSDTLITLTCSISGVDWKALTVKDSVLVNVHVDPFALTYESVSPGSDLPVDWTVGYSAGRSTRATSVFVLRGSSPIRSDGEWLRPRYRTLAPATPTVSASAEVRFVSLPLPCVETRSVPTRIEFASCVLNLRQVEFASTVAGLHAVRPNPARGPGVTVRYGMPLRSDVEIVVHDEVGREVLRPFAGVQSPGIYEADFSVADLAAGRYVVRMTSMGIVTTLPLVIVP
ncbi:MAG: T9SS type A sorting domain-containing protein, partial [Candidatus Kapaibacterium sp.]